MKSIKTVVKRIDSALRKLKKLINKYSNNKLIKALKYIKAEFPNIKDFKLELLIKKVYEIDDEGNEIRDDFMTLIK